MRLLDAVNDYLESRQSESPTYTLLSREDTAHAVKAISEIQHVDTKQTQYVRTFTDWASWDSYITKSFYGTGSRIDYAAEIGDLELSRLVQAAVRWIGKNLNDARFQVVKLDSDNKEKEIEGHKLAALFQRPNAFYSGAALWRGFALSWILDHEAFFLAPKNALGQPVELWYEPNATIRPIPSVSEFITGYEIFRNGRWQELNQKRIGVFVCRDGIDPVTRRGMGGLAAGLKDIYTEEQVSRYTSQLFKNGLVPPCVIGLGDKETPFPVDKLPEFRSDLERKTTGDNAGKPLLVTGPVKAEKLGFDYSSTGVKEIREISEAAFCSLVGIHAESLMFSCAGDHATYNNVREYRAGDYQDYIQPLHSLIAQEGDVQMLPAYQDGERVRCQWDYSKVELLQPNKDAEWKRAEGAYKSRIIDQAEAREAIGYKFNESHVGVYYPVPQANVTISPLGESVTDEMIDEAEKWWDQCASDEAKAAIEAKAIKPNGHAS